MTDSAYKQSTGRIRDKGTRVEYDGKSIRGLNGARITTRTPQFFTHFEGITIANLGFTTHGTGTTGNDAVLALSGGLRGLATMVTGTDAAAGQTAIAPLQLEPDVDAVNRPLVFETRFKVDDAFTNVLDITLGFTDSASQYTNDITNRISSTSTFTTSAPSDQAAFVFSSIPVSSGSLKASGTSTYMALVTTVSDTDTITLPNNKANYVIKASSPVFDLTAFHIYRVELDRNGSAYFFVDDLFVGYVNDAMDPTDPVWGHVNIVAPSGTSLTATLDYMLVAGGAS